MMSDKSKEVSTVDELKALENDLYKSAETKGFEKEGDGGGVGYHFVPICNEDTPFVISDCYIDSER